MSEPPEVIEAPEPRPNAGPGRIPGPNHFRYTGTGSKNNDNAYPYDEDLKWSIMADFIEVLCRGYTVDRAVRLLGHWATSPDKHRDINNIEHDERHVSYGRAIPARKTFYQWKKDYAEFSEAWDEAVATIGTEALEDHALDMAFAGDGKMVQFLLKARNPSRYANFGQLSGGGFQITITPGDENL